MPLSTICFGLWISHEWKAVYSLVGIGPEDSEKTRLCARHLHFGAVPKVQGWEGEACSLQWHFDLDRASWINPWTTTYSDAGAVHRIQSSHSVISGRQGLDCRCLANSAWVPVSLGGSHPVRSQYTSLLVKVSYTKPWLHRRTHQSAKHLSPHHRPPLFSSWPLGFVCACCICRVKWLKINEWSSLEEQVPSTHYVLTMPHLVWESCLPPLTPRQPGNKHSQRGWQGKMGWDGTSEMSGVDIIFTRTIRVKTCIKTWVQTTWSRGQKSEAWVQRNFIEARGRKYYSVRTNRLF